MTSGLRVTGSGRRIATKIRLAGGSTDLSEVKRGILAYLDGHPGAADSAVGIGRWWLPPNLSSVSTADVAVVLAAMVADKLLRTRRLPGGQMIFVAPRRPLSRN